MNKFASSLYCQLDILISNLMCIYWEREIDFYVYAAFYNKHLDRLLVIFLKFKKKNVSKGVEILKDYKMKFTLKHSNHFKQHKGFRFRF